MKYIIGAKIGMTQLFEESGVITIATRVKVGPCQVTQVKNKKTDGYNAVQIGFKPKRKLTKSLTGHLKGLPAFSYLREVRLPEGETSERGRLIDVSCFTVGENISVSGVTKSKGFQGVVKRHNFAGSPASHGHKDQLRMPGSIGAGGVQKVFKGMRMGGRMGGENMTINSLSIVKIDEDNSEIYIKGAIPGRTGAIVYIQAEGQMPEVKLKEEKITEEQVVLAETVTNESEEPKVGEEIQAEETIAVEEVSAEAENQEQETVVKE